MLNYLATAVVTLLHLQRMVQFFVYTHVAEKTTDNLNMLDMYIVKANAVTS